MGVNFYCWNLHGMFGPTRRETTLNFGNGWMKSFYLLLISTFHRTGQQQTFLSTMLLFAVPILTFYTDLKPYSTCDHNELVNTAEEGSSVLSIVQDCILSILGISSPTVVKCVVKLCRATRLNL